MSLKIAELFLTLSDTYQKIADEFSEGVGDVEQTSELAEDNAEQPQTAAEKKAAAAKKRREAAKAKKEAAAAETEAEADDDVDVDELLAQAQDLVRKYLRQVGTDEAKAILKKFGVAKVSEAADDAETLQKLIDTFTTALEEEDLA